MSGWRSSRLAKLFGFKQLVVAAKLFDALVAGIGYPALRDLGEPFSRSRADARFLGDLVILLNLARPADDVLEHGFCHSRYFVVTSF
jgi:hypothetical protein